MIKELMHDPIFLAGKSEEATKEDKFLKNTCKKNALCSIIDKHEYRKLMDFVRKTDPKAFVTVYSVNEMRYQPKIKK